MVATFWPLCRRSRALRVILHGVLGVRPHQHRGEQQCMSLHRLSPLTLYVCAQGAGFF